MARLQRKKPATDKKKKPSGGASNESIQVTNGAAAKRAPMFGGGADAGKKSPVATKKAAAGKQKTGYIDRALQFLREVKVELKKVTWPSRKQTVGSTVVVIVLVMIISFFLGAVDIGLSSLVGVILK